MIVLYVAIGLLLVQRLPLIRHMQSFGDVSGMDNLSHKVFFRLVEQHGGRIRHIRDEHFLLDPALDTGITYPLGYFKLLYFCGCRLWMFERIGPYITVFWDCCLYILIYAAMRITGGEHMYWLLFLPFQGILFEHMGRSFHHSERSFATFTGNLFVFAMGMTAIHGWSVLWLIVGMVAATASLTSSKFSWQALTGIPVLASIIIAEPIFLYFAALCIASAIVLSGGYAFTVVKGSISYLIYLAGRPRTNYYRQLFSLWSGKVHTVLWKLHYHPLIALFLLLPLNLVQFVASVEGPWEGIWLAGIALVFIISLPALSFLGHPARYMEYTLVPLFVLLSFNSTSALPVAIILIIIAVSALSTLSILRLHTWYYGPQLRRKQEDEQEALQFLLADAELHNGKPVVLSTSHRFSVKLYLATHKLRFVSFFSGVRPASRKDAYALLPHGENIGPDLAGYVEKYGVKYLIIDRASEREQHLRFHSRPGRIIFENPSIEIRLQQAHTATPA